jgi:long-chain acyl-CoA synthetase
MPFRVQELCAHQACKDYIQKQLEAEGRSAGLKGFEIVKKVHLHPELFSTDNDLLTPSFKLKRPELKKRFLAEIQQMYSQLPS